MPSPFLAPLKSTPRFVYKNIRFALICAAGLTVCSCASHKDSRVSPSPLYQTAAGTESTGLPANAVAESAQFGWPRVLVEGNVTNTIYPPQVDFWDGYKLIGRCAVAVQPASQAQPVFGVATIQAVTLVDKTARMVTLKSIQITSADFPSNRAQSPQFTHTLQGCFPKTLNGIPLEQLEASYSPPLQESKARSQTLNNSPPKILISTVPAILLYIDGPPQYRAVAGTSLMRVVNCRSLLFKDAHGVHYLRWLNGYMTAPGLDGPWKVASTPPVGAVAAQDDMLKAQAEAQEESSDSLGAGLSLTNSTPPQVLVATRPTELIVFEGQPNFVPISGTRLLYAANTSGNVFKSLSDQRDYVLISGRWFAASTLQGPWHFVPGHQLPPDFANIPDTSPKENVKACVPGTDQAAEALIQNSIPQSQEVARTTTMQTPSIDGSPRLEPIAGTPLSYVANSSTPIIRVNAHSWYACQNGTWFTATSVTGPWQVASSVPAIIYTIPPSSPLYYLTYVRVFGTTPENVYEGYTPGYFGTAVDEDDVVVYGTGYWYPPWVGAVWYGYPCTWGFGWGPCWTPWDDWCFDIGFGWGCGWGPYSWARCHPPAPWWGPYHNGYHTGGIVAGRPPHSFPTTGTVVQTRPPRTSGVSSSRPLPSYGRAYNSRTGTLVAGQSAGVRNVLNPDVRGATPFGNGRAQGQVGPWRSSVASSTGRSPGSSWTHQGGAGHYAGWNGWNPSAGGSYRGAGVSHGGGFSHGGGGFSHGGGGFSHGGGGFSHGGGGGGGGGGHGGGGNGSGR